MKTPISKILSRLLVTWLTLTIVVPGQFLMNVPIVKAATITVDSNLDTLDADTNCSTVNVADLPGVDGNLTLREAICAANNDAGADTIQFSGAMTITLTSTPPSIEDDLTTITTGASDVRINGNAQTGIDVSGNSHQINGIKLYGFDGDYALRITGSGNTIGDTGANDPVYVYDGGGTAATGIQILGENNSVQHSYIGLDASKAADGFSSYGIMTSGTGAAIGGEGSTYRNIIADNASANVLVVTTGIYTAYQTLVLGNYIGLNEAGTATLGANGAGVALMQMGEALSEVVVGGENVDRRNVIAGNAGNGGIYLDYSSGGAAIQGNYIGVAADGNTAIGNGSSGNIHIDNAANLTIGGSTSSARNIISGATGKEGITIDGGSSIAIQGNYIGLNAAGDAKAANTTGVQVNAGTNILIGGTSAGEGNVISGNTNGIKVSGSGTQFTSAAVRGNFIGTYPGGASASESVTGNSYGVFITGDIGNGTVFVGDPSTNGRNIISGNIVGIALDAMSNATVNVNGNYVGTDVDGLITLQNGSNDQTAGLYMTATSFSNNTITVGDSSSSSITNVFSGNANGGAGGAGFSLYDSISIYSTAIGTNAGGTGAIANGAGITVADSADGTMVVGNNSLTTGFNLISGNSIKGIDVGNSAASLSLTVSGNLVGTNIDGDSAVANPIGIYISSTNSSTITMGNSSASSATNVISGNTGTGIVLANASNASVYSSYIGVNKGGTGSVANGGVGIDISGATDTTIGSTSSAGQNILTSTTGKNVISIAPGSGGTSLFGNIIGTNTSGDTDMCGGIGISSGTGMTVGSTTAGWGNEIAYCTTGISTADASSTNKWRRNNWHNNDNDITITDDSNAPITSVSTTTTTTNQIAGTSSLASGTIVDVYTRSTSGGSMTYQGSATSSSPWSLTGLSVSPGDVYVIVATDPSDNSTILSSEIAVKPNAPSITYATTVYNTSTTGIAVTAATTDVGANVYVNGVDSGYNIGADGTSTVTVNLTRGASNTFIIKLVDSDGDETSTVTATITEATTGGGGGGGGGGSSRSTDTSDTSDTDRDELAGEEEAGEEYDGGELAGEEEAGEEDYTLPGEEEEEVSEPEQEPEEESSPPAGAPAEETPTEEEPLHEAAAPEPEEEIEPQAVTIRTLLPVIDDNFDQWLIDPDILKPITIDISEDDDGDAMPDYCEKKYFGDTDASAEDDSDQDGLDNSSECAAGTDPLNADSDNDGLADGEEIAAGTDPTDWDSDGDGINDSDDIAGVEPPTVDPDEYDEDTDSDGDGLSDYYEVSRGTDPNDTDSDDDGITDVEEQEYGLDPNTPDTTYAAGAKITNINNNATVASSEMLVSGTCDSTSAIVYVLDSAGNIVGVYDGEVDEKGKFAVKITGDLSDGSYGMFTACADDKNLEDVSPLKNFTVDSDQEVGMTLEEIDDFTLDKMGAKKVFYLTMTAEYTRTEVDMVAFGTSEPYADVKIEVLDEDGSVLAEGVGVTNEDGKFAIEIAEDIADGEYDVNVTIVEKGEVSLETSVESILQVERPRTKLEALEQARGELTIANPKPRIRGLAKPGSTIYATWKSLIFTSVVVADSETGEFEIEPPADLESGEEHIAYLYPVDEEEGVVGKTLEVNFVLEADLHGSAAMREREDEKFPYAWLVLIAVIAFGGAFIFSRKRTKSEKELIRKL